MKLRVSFIILAILSTVAMVLVMAKYPSGPNTMSYDHPWEVWLAVLTNIAMALPALILGFFNNLICRIISAILQMFAVMMYGLFIIVAFAAEIVPVGLMALLTVLLILLSTFMTLFIGYPKSQHYESGTEI
ncbi:hypothetical protein QP156_10430 [Staphylococcus caprae]|uniref:hypothetical protein n=1 Tax=Staphylococcus caprae TaxID=29380 RepID=UPI00254BB5F6|nr:hypothetical protein [Staphylococcus caprae]MDK6298435.1 hypothetical protein [Staphylococcus caprae]MDK7233351.1 hypothetical protein [Staphylococcus caprae]